MPAPQEFDDLILYLISVENAVLCYYCLVLPYQLQHNTSRSNCQPPNSHITRKSFPTISFKIS